MGPYRTFLFTPGNHPRRLAKVFDAGADAAILDLEDAVATAEKVAARATVIEALQRPRACTAFVRVNGAHTDFCFGDLAAVVGPNLDGIVLPMAESARQLQTVDWVIAGLERERGLPVGGIDLMPIIETAKGAKALAEIASSGTRVKRLAFGAGDYTLDLGMHWSIEEDELNPIRAAMVLESRAAGLEPPIDTVFLHLKEEERLLQSAVIAMKLGFQGKLCIHPDQIDPVAGLFTPGPEEVAYALRVVQAFDKAEAEGSAAIQIDGRFVDYPIVARSRRTLDLARRLMAQAQHNAERQARLTRIQETPHEPHRQP